MDGISDAGLNSSALLLLCCLVSGFRSLENEGINYFRSILWHFMVVLWF